jgi:hypothetical protein
MAETVMAKDERTRTIAKRGRTEEQRVVQRARAGAYHAAREFHTRAHETAVLRRCVRRPGGLKRKRTKPKTAFRGKFFETLSVFGAPSRINSGAFDPEN